MDTSEQAIQKLSDDGYTSVAVRGLGVVPGVEYEYGKLVDLDKPEIPKKTGK